MHRCDEDGDYDCDGDDRDPDFEVIGSGRGAYFRPRSNDAWEWCGAHLPDASYDHWGYFVDWQKSHGVMSEIEAAGLIV